MLSVLTLNINYLADKHGAWASLHPSEKGLTFEADSPTIRIDYAWLNPLLASKLSAVEIVENEALDGQARMSDHLGLVVRLSL